MRCVGRRGLWRRKGDTWLWRSKGDTWLWNEEVKEAVSRKKDACKVICRNNTEDNNRRYKSTNNKVKTAALKAKREKTEESLTELKNYINGMFW